MSDNFSRRRALTYIAVALVLVVGFPAGAFAVVAGSKVFLTDPSKGYEAHVNSSGQLLTNVSGSSVKVSNTVPVSGTVKIAVGTPYTTSCHVTEDATTPTYVCTTAAVPSGVTFVVQGLTGYARATGTDRVAYGEAQYRPTGQANADGSPSTLAQYDFPMTFGTTGGTAPAYYFYSATAEPEIYVAGGSRMTLAIYTSVADSQLAGQITLTGYLR